MAEAREPVKPTKWRRWGWRGARFVAASIFLAILAVPLNWPNVKQFARDTLASDAHTGTIAPSVGTRGASGVVKPPTPPVKPVMNSGDGLVIALRVFAGLGLAALAYWSARRKYQVAVEAAGSALAAANREKATLEQKFKALDSDRKAAKAERDAVVVSLESANAALRVTEAERDSPRRERSSLEMRLATAEEERDMLKAGAENDVRAAVAKATEKLHAELKARDAAVADLMKRGSVWAKDRANYEATIAKERADGKAISELANSLDKELTRYRDAQEGGPARLTAALHDHLDYVRDWLSPDAEEIIPPHEFVGFRKWVRELRKALSGIVSPRGVAVFRQACDEICDDSRNLQHPDDARFRAALKRLPLEIENVRYDWYTPPALPPQPRETS